MTRDTDAAVEQRWGRGAAEGADEGRSGETAMGSGAAWGGRITFFRFAFSVFAANFSAFSSVPWSFTCVWPASITAAR